MPKVSHLGSLQVPPVVVHGHLGAQLGQDNLEMNIAKLITYLILYRYLNEFSDLYFFYKSFIKDKAKNIFYQGENI